MTTLKDVCRYTGVPSPQWLYHYMWPGVEVVHLQTHCNDLVFYRCKVFINISIVRGKKENCFILCVPNNCITGFYIQVKMYDLQYQHTVSKINIHYPRYSEGDLLTSFMDKGVTLGLSFNVSKIHII